MTQNAPALFSNPSEIQHIQGNASANAEMAKSIQEVQASLVIAKRFPRDEIRAIDKIRNECSKPRLAAQALYQYARGGSDISGPSIRLAEALARHWGNITAGISGTSRGVGQDGIAYTEVTAFAWDIETNTRRSVNFIVRHWRDKRNGGGTALTEERDISELISNQASRRIRGCILSLIPGDVIDDAVDQCNVTLAADADTSPEAQNKLVKAFAEYGVTKPQIEIRIQRRMDAITPAQVVQLRKIYTSLKDGMSTPSEWFDAEKTDAPAPKLPTTKASTKASATPLPWDAVRAAVAKHPGMNIDDVVTWAEGKGLQDHPDKVIERWDEFILDYKGE